MAYQALLTVDGEQRQLLHLDTRYFQFDNFTFCQFCKEHPFRTLDMLEGLSRQNKYAFRPKSEIFGGVFNLCFESTDQDDWFYHCFKECYVAHGLIDFYNDNEDDFPFKRIEFWDAWISDISESFSSVSSSPMMFYCSISPATVRINKEVVFRKSWWITDINVAEGEGKNEEKGSITLKRAYWIDKEGKEQEELDFNSPVTLYIELCGDYEPAQELDITLSTESDEGVKKVSVTGTVNNEGILEIESFKFEENQ